MNYLSFSFVFLFLFSAISDARAQQEKPPLFIHVLVDADKQIYVQNRKVKFEEIAGTVKKIVYSQPASKYEGVVYRIFGDESLRLGFIMDVGNELREGFLLGRVQRFLLKLEEKEIDGNNYIKKLEKLDLKAIEH